MSDFGELFLQGKRKMEDIIITTTDTFFSYPDDIQRKINALWDETSKRALEEGKLCYNGISYRLDDWKIDEQNGKLNLHFSKIEYKNRMCSRFLRDELFPKREMLFGKKYSQIGISGRN